MGGIAKHLVSLNKKNTHACEVYRDMGIVELCTLIYKYRCRVHTHEYKQHRRAVNSLCPTYWWVNWRFSTLRTKQLRFLFYIRGCQTVLMMLQRYKIFLKARSWRWVFFCYIIHFLVFIVNSTIKSRLSDNDLYYVSFWLHKNEW